MNLGICRRKCFAWCAMGLKLNQFNKTSQEKSWIGTARDARLDIVARGFWERQRSAFFDVRICQPNADSYRDMDLNQIYKRHETEKKSQYASRILEVEQATFTPLVFSTTGGIAAEFKRYHSRLAELIATKKGDATWLPCPGSGLGCPLRCWDQHYYAWEVRELRGGSI